MNSHCRIGKIKLKGGGEVSRLHNNTLREVVSNSNLPNGAQSYIADLVREGRAQAVLVATIFDDGRIWAGFDKDEGVHCSQLVGAVAAMHEQIMDYWRN